MRGVEGQAQRRADGLKAASAITTGPFGSSEIAFDVENARWRRPPRREIDRRASAVVAGYEAEASQIDHHAGLQQVLGRDRAASSGAAAGE